MRVSAKATAWSGESEPKGGSACFQTTLAIAGQFRDLLGWTASDGGSIMVAWVACFLPRWLAGQAGVEVTAWVPGGVESAGFLPYAGHKLANAGRRIGKLHGLESPGGGQEAQAIVMPRWPAGQRDLKGDCMDGESGGLGVHAFCRAGQLASGSGGDCPDGESGGLGVHAYLIALKRKNSCIRPAGVEASCPVWRRIQRGWERYGPLVKKRQAVITSLPMAFRLQRANETQCNYNRSPTIVAYVKKSLTILAILIGIALHFCHHRDGRGPLRCQRQQPLCQRL